jgi:hypothetical protein
MNLSFDGKVMLVVRVIYTYTIATYNSLDIITLGPYVLSTILIKSNIIFIKYFVGQILF